MVQTEIGQVKRQPGELNRAGQEAEMR